MCGKYARAQFRNASRYAVCSSPGGDDWRPSPTKALRSEHPLVWDLIQECWRSEKTKVKGALASVSAADVAKRPTFLMIVERLEAMQPACTTRTSLADMDLDVFPKRDPRYFCCGEVPADAWEAAIAKLTGPTSMEAWCKARCAKELALIRNMGPSWKYMFDKSIPENVKVEWMHTSATGKRRSSSNTSARLYRITVPLQLCKDPKLAFNAFVKSQGTAKGGTQGDRSVENVRILHEFDNNHIISWQVQQ